MSSSNSLVWLLGKWFEFDPYYVSIEDDLSELEYVIPDNNIHDDVTLRVYELGSDYSELDPERNPMGFVIEFNFPNGATRWLEVFGHYVSHDGGYWDGYREVTRKEKMVVVFE